MDRSKDALELAASNGFQLDLEVQWQEADALTGSGMPAENSLDLVISNPPYVPDQEKSWIDALVIDHEPHLALFVPDNDPLVFYRAIGTWALGALRPSGQLFFEIHERLGKPVVDLLNELGWSDVSLRQDLSGKDRMVAARHPIQRT